MEISRQADFNLTDLTVTGRFVQSPLKTLFPEAASPFRTFFLMGSSPHEPAKSIAWISETFNKSVSSNLGVSWSRGEISRNQQVHHYLIGSGQKL